MRRLLLIPLLLLSSAAYASEGYDVTVPGPSVPVDDSARYVIEQLTLLRPVAGRICRHQRRSG